MKEGIDDIINDILEDRIHLKVARLLENMDTSYGQMCLYPRQVELIKFFLDNWHMDEIVINKARQTGVSRLTQGVVIDRCVREHDNYTFIIHSHRRDSSMYILDGISEMCSGNSIKYTRNKTGELEINGNLITSNIDKLKIENNKRVVVIYDEYAHHDIKSIQRVENLLRGHKNPLQVFTSTPNGKNHFYDKCIKNSVFIINWLDVPIRNEIWKNQQIQMLGDNEDLFEQEYNNKFISR